MKCQKCQTENIEGAQFCAKCGAKLETAEAPVTETTTVSQETVFTPNDHQSGVVAERTTVVETVRNAEGSASNMTDDGGMSNNTPDMANTNNMPGTTANTMNSSIQNSAAGTVNMNNDLASLPAIIVACMLKPDTTFREEAPKLGVAKNACILAAVSLVFSVIITLFSAMLSGIFTKSCSYFSSKCKLEIDFGGLGDVKYFDVLWQALVGYAIMIVVVAGIFFAVSQIFKEKHASFLRFLSITALAAVPITVISFLGTIASIFSTGVGLALMMIGLVVGATIFFTGVVSESKLSGDKKVYYLLISTVAVMVACIILGWLLGDKIGFFAKFDLVELM